MAKYVAFGYELEAIRIEGAVIAYERRIVTDAGKQPQYSAMRCVWCNGVGRVWKKLDDDWCSVECTRCQG